MSFLSAIAGAHPELASYITAPRGGDVLSPSAFCQPDRLSSAVKATGDSLHMNGTRDATQVWFYRFVNALSLPSCAAMVEDEVCADLSLESCLITWMDPLWYTIEPQDTVATVEESARTYASTVAAVIDVLTDVSEVRPAPLWALAVDSPVDGLIRYGMRDFASGEGYALARAFHSALVDASGRRLPDLTVEVLREGEWTEEDVRSDDDDVFLLYHRCSCCKIFRSPDADLCSDCPRRDAKTRRREAQARAQYF